MRIAVSGSHATGKSTLIADFLAAHADYAHEPEPYEWLDETAETPDIDDFYRQLEISVERLSAYEPGARVIAERSPLDFLAYILACDNLRRGRASDVLDAAVELAARGMQHVDLLVLLPITGIASPHAEDPELREAMDEQLSALVASDEHEVLGPVRVVELRGSPERRLAQLEAAVSA